MSKDEVVKIKLTAMEAKRTIENSVGKKFFIGAMVSLPVIDNPGYVFSTYTGVKVTKKEMLKCIDDLLKNLEERGARVELKIHEWAIFI